MSNLRRYYSQGQIYFVTAVTYNRMPILVEEIGIFRALIKSKILEKRSNVIALCVLPDHFHMMIDPQRNDLSLLIKSFELSFSKLYMYKHDLKKHRIWQYRFWDHIIRDQRDMNNHINYIHYNPVKHGFTCNPFEWQYSSIHKFYRQGYYSKGWGINKKIEFEGNYGE